eukprot:1160089-Pelagomonas_calceolata.AAC.2
MLLAGLEQKAPDGNCKGMGIKLICCLLRPAQLSPPIAKNAGILHELPGGERDEHLESNLFLSIHNHFLSQQGSNTQGLYIRSPAHIGKHRSKREVSRSHITPGLTPLHHWSARESGNHNNEDAGPEIAVGLKAAFGLEAAIAHLGTGRATS